MKKLTYIVVTLAILSLSSCGINYGLCNQFSTYGSNTNVVLQKKNFQVIGQVSGHATDSYFLGFGGLSKNLVERAKTDMMKQADLTGKARAVVNITVEYHRSRILLYSTRTIIVSGTVVEFTD